MGEHSNWFGYSVNFFCCCGWNIMAKAGGRLISFSFFLFIYLFIFFVWNVWRGLQFWF